eukprot:757076-Hanusia_phi.AAC.1
MEQDREEKDNPEVNQSMRRRDPAFLSPCFPAMKNFCLKSSYCCPRPRPRVPVFGCSETARKALQDRR